MLSSGKKRKSVLKYQTCESALTNNQTEQNKTEYNKTEYNRRK